MNRSLLRDRLIATSGRSSREPSIAAQQVPVSRDGVVQSARRQPCDGVGGLPIRLGPVAAGRLVPRHMPALDGGSLMPLDWGAHPFAYPTAAERRAPVSILSRGGPDPHAKPTCRIHDGESRANLVAAIGTYLRQVPPSYRRTKAITKQSRRLVMPNKSASEGYRVQRATPVVPAASPFVAVAWFCTARTEVSNRSSMRRAAN